MSHTQTKEGQTYIEVSRGTLPRIDDKIKDYRCYVLDLNKIIITKNIDIEKKTKLTIMGAPTPQTTLICVCVWVNLQTTNKLSKLGQFNNINKS
jgi:hypothetical protein